MKLNGYYIIAVSLLMLPIFSSCRKNLCYNHFPVAEVNLEWEREWERDYGMAHAENWDASLHGFEYSFLTPDLPEWVNLVKFKREGNMEEYFLDVDGGKVQIDNNVDQSFLLYNGDTEYIVLKDMASLATARATTTSRSRSRSSLSYLQSLGPEMRSANPPDLLYAAFVEEIPKINVHESRPVPIRMQPLVYTYIIRYEFEYGLQHVALARGAIGGMAESVYLRDGVTSDESAILLYDCVLTDYGCEAHVRSFGVPSFPDDYYGRPKQPKSTVPVAVNLELRLKNGKYLDLNFDVSDIIKNQPRGGVIRITGIRVEDEMNQGGGGAFDVDVDGWGDEEVIEM